MVAVTCITVMPSQSSPAATPTSLTARSSLGVRLRGSIVSTGESGPAACWWVPTCTTTGIRVRLSVASTGHWEAEQGQHEDLCGWRHGPYQYHAGAGAGRAGACGDVLQSGPA